MVAKKRHHWDLDWHGTCRGKKTAERRVRKWRERGFEAKMTYNRIHGVWFIYIRKVR